MGHEFDHESYLELKSSVGAFDCLTIMSTALLGCLFVAGQGTLSSPEIYFPKYVSESKFLEIYLPKYISKNIFPGNDSQKIGFWKKISRNIFPDIYFRGDKKQKPIIKIIILILVRFLGGLEKPNPAKTIDTLAYGS